MELPGGTQIPTPTQCAEIIEVLNGLLDRNMFNKDQKQSIAETIMTLVNLTKMQVSIVYPTTYKKTGTRKKA